MSRLTVAHAGTQAIPIIVLTRPQLGSVDDWCGIHRGKRYFDVFITTCMNLIL